MRSPKSEIRGPKEARSPKSELGAYLQAISLDFWSWGDDWEQTSGAHREDSVAATRPMPLQERTARFGEAIIKFAKKIARNAVNNPLISQLVRAATSIGANYCEADDAVSGKEFKQKIGTCRKEARETKFFLRMVATAEPNLKPQGRILWQEAKELHLIFSSIWRK